MSSIHIPEQPLPMKRAFMIVALAGAVLPFSSPGEELQPQRAGHIIVIGVDGLSPDGVRRARTPVLDRLMKNGSTSMHARTVLPSSSSPNWASMIMGVGPEIHGITSNDWERDETLLPPAVTGMENIFPTIFGTLRRASPTAAIGAVYHWSGFGRLFEKSAVSFDRPAETEQEAARIAARYIRDATPQFLFVHLDHVDGAGHSSGHGTPEYYAAVERADSLIGTILDAAAQAKIDSDLVVIVSADHGGVGRGHGGETLEETEIPFIIAGKGVRKDVELTQPVYIYDIAATVAFIAGVPRPYAWTGRPVLSAFTGESLPTDEEFTLPVAAPVFEPVVPGYGYGGTLTIGGPATVTLRHEDRSAVIHYTLDGTTPVPSSAVYAGPFSLERGGVVKARAFTSNGRGGRTAIASYRVAHEENSVTYAYFEGPAWSQMPDFSTMVPVRKGEVKELRLEGTGARPENFGLVFDGYLKIERGGRYEFATVSDDGSKLFVNSREVVNNDGDHGPRARTGDIDLAPGLVPVRALYFNGGGGAWLDVLYKGPGIPRQVLPAHLLFPGR
jgi:hypothetical protein